MRLAALLALAALALVLDSSSMAAPPPGATALCRDGTYSFSQHHSGTCSHHGGVAKWLDGTGTTTTAGTTTTVPAPLGHTVLLAQRTKTSGCVPSALPDRHCSPGAYYRGLTKAVICSASFRTGTIRNVPQSEKYAVETEYDMPARLYGRTIEIDHIVSLELSGSNDIANLFPEPGSGAASYHVKDKLENKLHDLVCAGTMTLSAVRTGIAKNWETIYKQVYQTTP
jgi:Protein of unknown function (DUF3761)